MKNQFTLVTPDHMTPLSAESFNVTASSSVPPTTAPERDYEAMNRQLDQIALGVVPAVVAVLGIAFYKHWKEDK